MQPNQPPRDDDNKSWIGCAVALMIIPLVLILLFLTIYTNSANIFRLRFMGETIHKGQGGNTAGSGASGSLVDCQKIPDEWRSHFDQAATSSGASPALIAAIFAAGEHRFYQGQEPWPRYTDNPAYGSGLNPTKHDGGAGGWVRGLAQFKEETFQNMSPDAKRDGRPSRFGTSFKVEPYIEQTQPALTAAGAYLNSLGGKNGASEGDIKRAIFAYYNGGGARYRENHPYINLVYPAYEEYNRCTSGSANAGGPIIYNGQKACPVGNGTADWGPVRRSNPHVPTYPGHEGIDIMSSRGTPIYSVTAGKVLAVGWGGGWRIWIDDGQGHYWFYQHMIPNERLVSVGQSVQPGTLIGHMSNSGAEDSVVHLHLGIAKSPRAGTGGAGQMRWDQWYYPYDMLNDIPCLSRTLRQ